MWGEYWYVVPIVVAVVTALLACIQEWTDV